MLLSPTTNMCQAGLHPAMCVQTDTSVEADESEEHDGSIVVNMTIRQIEYCSNCNKVLHWR